METLKNGWTIKGSVGVKLFGDALVKVYSTEALTVEPTLGEKATLDITYLEIIAKEARETVETIKSRRDSEF